MLDIILSLFRLQWWTAMACILVKTYLHQLLEDMSQV